MKKPNVYIIGGGASGLVAAIIAKRQGANVTIIERNSRIGKKILVTGNGRCNYTNSLANIYDYNNPDFVSYGLSVFNPQRAMSFFSDLGIVPKIENEGKTYPLSEQASSIVDVLLYEINRLGIDVLSDSLVTSVLKRNKEFNIYLEDGRVIDADRLIIATGGKALSSTGSDGSGYDLAKDLGHNIVTPFPSLVKLKLDSPYLKHLQGIKMPAIAELIHKDKVIQSESGDILFGNYGISGPTILQLSRKANDLFLNGEKVYIKIILVSQMTRKDVESRFEKSKDKAVDQSLIGMINKRYISAILKESKIEKQKTKVKDLSDKQLKKLIDLLFDWRFPIRGSKSFNDAQVTAGGVDLNEIDDQTMESKLVKGLFFVGEVMDIDGRCGGYNLQWAWSSGYLAGINSSKE